MSTMIITDLQARLQQTENSDSDPCGNLVNPLGIMSSSTDLQEIRRRKKVVIIGPSGFGKSTFLRCLNLLEEPTSGKIYFGGIDLTNKNTDINAVRRKMGMVFQH